MKKMMLAASVFFLMAPGSLRAGCTVMDVCADTIDSLHIHLGGDNETVDVTWRSDSEPSELSYYRVVRSDQPGIGEWTEVEVIYPEYQCGGTPAAYRIEEVPPDGTWIYAVQVFGENGLVCTIVGN